MAGSESAQFIRDLDALDPSIANYRPNGLPERSEQMDELENLFRLSAEMGGSPRNVFVHGPTGQGKTLGVKLLMEKYSQQTGDDFTPIWVGCDGASKSYQVLTKLLQAIRVELTGPGVEEPSGYTKQQLWQRIRTGIEEIGGTVIIALDEVRAIEGDQYVLYQLSDVGSTKVDVGTIWVTNDSQFISALESKVRSRLGERRIHFPPYNADQLRNILTRRALEAFTQSRLREGVAPEDAVDIYKQFESRGIESGVIPKIAAEAATQTGDARHALQLLQRATEQAMLDGAQKVAEHHMETAERKLRSDAVQETIRSETLHRKAALLALCELGADGQLPGETLDVYTAYTDLIEQASTEPVAQNTFWTKLDDLNNSNLVEKETRSRGYSRGRTNVYSLAVTVDDALEGLVNDENQTLRQKAQRLLVEVD